MIHRDGLLGVTADAAEAAYWHERITQRRRALEELLPQSDKVILKQDRTKVAAELGDVDAQYALGGMYEDPKGLNDYDRSRDWYLRAAAQGSAEAMFALGRVTAGYDEYYWWLQAARHGHGAGCQNTAWSYLEGRTGVPVDERKGLAWMREAAALGNDDAIYHIGEFYAMGRGVPRDLAKAREWYVKAARMGSPDAQDALVRLDQLQQREPAFPIVLSDGAPSPEAKEILRWLSTLGLPSVRDLATVRVETGNASMSGGVSTPIFTTGYLVEKTADRVVILNPVLGLEKYKNPSRRSGPNPVEEITYEEFTEPLLAPSAYYAMLPFGMAPLPPPVVANFLMAWCSQEKKRDDLAAKFLAGAAEAMRSSPVPRSLEMLKAEFSEYFFQLAILDFADLTLSRAQVAERLRAFAAKHPDTPEAAKALVLAAGLDSLIKEEARRPADVPAGAPAEERARVLVWRLREMGDDKSGSNPVEDLITLGDAAVPAVIAALDDHRPTRFAGSSAMDRMARANVLTIGDYAGVVLGPATRGYPIHGRSDRMGTPSPAEPSPLRREYEAWWAAYQAKGDRQLFLDGIRAGGPDAQQFYSTFTHRYPDAASEAAAALAEGYRASSAEVREDLIQRQPELRDPAWIQALAEEVKDGNELPLKIRAAARLRAFGKAPDSQMMQEWRSVLGDWEKYASGAYDNGAFDLLAYLLASDDPEIAGKTTRDFPSFSFGKLDRMFEGLSRAYETSADDRNQPAPPAARASVEKIFASFLLDDRESWTDPRVCSALGDRAAVRLAKLLPGKQKFDPGASFADRAAARLRMLNAWRASVNLPPLPAVSAPVLNGEDRNTITDVTFGDHLLDGTPLHAEIGKLRGQKLSPDPLVRLLCDFSAHLPKGVSGLRIRAVRDPGGAVTLTVWSEQGSTDPAKRYAWTTMAVSRDGKNLHAETDVPGLEAAATPESWQEFSRALAKALGGAPNTEIIARIGLEHGDKE